MAKTGFFQNSGSTATTENDIDTQVTLAQTAATNAQNSETAAETAQVASESARDTATIKATEASNSASAASTSASNASSAVSTKFGDIQTTTTTGAAGSNAAVSYTDSTTTFAFTVPQGATGATGAQGIQGATGATGAQGIQGATGATGAAGTDGSDGDAATIAVGSVTTGAAGSAATVTNVGSSSAATFNFSIPRGDTGATGAQGSQGIQGATGATGATGAQGIQGIQGVAGADGSDGSTTFIGLTDTPSSFTASKFLAVNSGGTAVELVDAPSGGGGGNATTLDSLDSTQFLRSDAADTKTSGNLRFNDSVKATFGTTDDDLQIFHSGTNSFIQDLGTGNLYITSNGTQILLRNTADNEDLAKFINGGAVELYHDSNLKVSTTSTGMSVTGTLQAGIFKTDATPSASSIFNTSTNLYPLLISRGDDETQVLQIGVDDAQVIFNSLQDEQYGGFLFTSEADGVGTRNRLVIDNGDGDISFYNNTGANRDFYWDATNSRLGINNTSPSTALDVNGDLTLTSTDAGATENPTLDLYRNSSSPADQDIIGHINFSGENDADEKIVYGEIQTRIRDMTDGTENGAIETYVETNGSLQLYSVHQDGESQFYKDVQIISNDAGSTENPTLQLYRNSASPAVSDFVGTIMFSGENDANEKLQYAEIQAQISDETDGTEDGSLYLQVRNNGSLLSAVAISGAAKRVNVASDFDLFLQEDATIRFEGATSNDFETTLTVTDPTADRTITLPDASGTVLLNTGNQSITGGLTTTAADGSGTLNIVSSDNNTNSGNKIAFFGAGRTDTDEEMAFIKPLLTSNSGGAGNVQDGHLTFGTFGNERMRIASGGNVGIGTTLPDGNMHIFNSSAGTVTAPTDANELVLESAANVGMSFLTANSSIARIKFGDPDATNSGVIAYNHSDDSLRFNANGAERMRINSSGNVGIGTTAPADKLHIYKGASGKSSFSSNTAILIEDNVAAALQFATPNTVNQQILFSDPESNTSGKIQYQHSTNLMTFDTDGDESMRITSGHTVVGRSEGGTANRVSFTQGSAKSWVTFDMDSNNAILDDYNVSSLTDNATGKNTVNIDNNMNNVNYGITFGFEDNSSNVNAVKLQEGQIPTTGAFKVQGGAFQNGSTNTQFDINRTYCVTHGRQA
jgi:uncharacterized protein (UPF0254 family)